MTEKKEVGMNEVMMLRKSEPRRILEVLVKEKAAAILSYSSRGKWHVIKVTMASLGASRIAVQVSPRKSPHPINVQVDQSVGMSVKYGYGKFIFETKVQSLEPSVDGNGGMIIINMPQELELVQRRSYFRVQVPQMLQVDAVVWHCCYAGDTSHAQEEHCWQGRLVDVSAGGLQIVFEADHKPNIRPGQFMGVQFQPLPGETTLTFNAQVRNVLATADDSKVCYGLQVVGLEASNEGRLVLQRLCDVVEQYYRLNQSQSRKTNSQKVSNPSD